MTKRPLYRHLSHIPTVQEQSIVFFTSVTSQRRHLLSQQSTHGILHTLWQRSGERNGWYVGDYVLMPDHIHLFARASHNADPMRDWIKMWKSVSARRLMAALDVETSIWQEEYFDRYLRSSESYAEKWDYVRNNPVRAGLVADPNDWPYQGRIHELRY